MKNKILWLILGTCLAPIAYFSLFYNLSKPAIFIWDEAIYANNAFEMASSGNFIVLQNNGEPNFYNVKPPLVIWLQSICIWVFGPNELAIRLPSAFAALLTCFMILVFSKRNLNLSIGVVAVLILLSSAGYVRPHVSRSGDLDSVLIFFITAYSLTFFDYILKEGHKARKTFLLISILIFGAFLSKSVAGLMPLAGLFFGSIFIKRGRALFLNKWIFIYASITILLCAGFYGLREWMHPGYFEIVWHSEWSRIGENIMPWHEHPFLFYAENMKDSNYEEYLVLIPIAFVGLFSVENSKKQFALLGVIFCIFYFLIISWPPVKLNYYDAPLYPILALLIATGLYRLYNFCLTQYDTPVWIFILVGAIWFSIPYRSIIQKNLEYLPNDFLQYDGFAIRELSRTNPELKKYKILFYPEHIEHIDQMNFYVKALKQSKNYNLEIVQSAGQLKNFDIVLCSQPRSLDSLKARFELEEIQKLEKATLFKIKKR